MPNTVASTVTSARGESCGEECGMWTCESGERLLLQISCVRLQSCNAATRGVNEQAVGKVCMWCASTLTG